MICFHSSLSETWSCVAGCCHICLFPVAVCEEGVSMLRHCHFVMVSHAIMELISLSAPGMREASNEPCVMTLHVFHIQTHPSLWSPDRTKATPACGKWCGYTYMCLVYLCFSPCGGIPVGQSAYVYLYIWCRRLFFVLFCLCSSSYM